MRILILTVLMAIFIGTAAVQAQQSLQFQPEKPTPGEKIQISYNPSGTPMLGVKDFDGYAYFFNGTVPSVQKLQLSQHGSSYTGWIRTEPDTRAVFVSFSGKDVKDNNNDKGYCILMYSGEGQPLSEALLAKASAYFSYGYYWGLKRNTSMAQELQKKVFDDPENRTRFRQEYLNYLASLKDDAAKDQLKAELSRITEDPSASEHDYQMAQNFYLRPLNDTAKADATKALILKKFPNGNLVKNEREQSIIKEKKIAKKIEGYDQFVTDMPPQNSGDSGRLGIIATSIAAAFAEKGDLKNMKVWEARSWNASLRLASSYNSVAWKMAGEGMDGKPGDIKTGKLVSWRSLQLVEQVKKTGEGKPGIYTDKQWRDILNRNWAMFADSYALLLYRLNETEKAYEYEKKAIEAYDRKYTDLNEAYSVYTEKVKGPETAMRELVSFVKSGSANSKMKAQLKRLYLANHHTEDEWKTYVAGLEKAKLEKMREELAKKMINEPAPEFALRDVDGKEVSLASLQGKIVILDFWATWCGPCKASFPGMKKAVERYKNDPNVKFVFIDTWEHGDKDQVKKLVADFISDHTYPFYVLMDYENKVVDQFGVEGIPTKFVIDGNHRIRFRSVGFSGDTDALAVEMGYMIEMAKAGGNGGEGKKGF